MTAMVEPGNGMRTIEDQSSAWNITCQLFKLVLWVDIRNMRMELIMFGSDLGSK